MKLSGSLVAMAASAALVFGTVAFTQEKADDAPKPAGTAKVAKSEEKPEKPKGRLPANYGKLDLTQAQREKIYGIQASYEPKIDELAEQIKELIAQRATDIEDVLTPAQKNRLTELRTAAKEKAAARRKELDAKKAGAAAEPEKDAGGK